MQSTPLFVLPRLAAAVAGRAATGVATTIVIHQQHHDDEEQNPSAIVATEKVFKTHTPLSSFLRMTRRVCPTVRQAVPDDRFPSPLLFHPMRGRKVGEKKKPTGKEIAFSAGFFGLKIHFYGMHAPIFSVVPYSNAVNISSRSSHSFSPSVQAVIETAYLPFI